jgi:hypothetical protein
MVSVFINSTFELLSSKKTSKPHSAWVALLDCMRGNTLIGPHGINVFFLSNSLKELAPYFHYYYGLSYCKQLSKLDDSEIPSFITQHISKINSFKPNLIETTTFEETWKKKYYPIETGENIFIKTVRSQRFIDKEDAIQAKIEATSIHQIRENRLRAVKSHYEDGHSFLC